MFWIDYPISVPLIEIYDYSQIGGRCDAMGVRNRDMTGEDLILTASVNDLMPL